MTIHGRIKQIRIDSGLTQEDFAEKIGMKRGNYSQIELGKQLPTIDAITSIARNFSKSYDWIIEGTEGTRKNVHLTVHPNVHPMVQESREKYIKTGDTKNAQVNARLRKKGDLKGDLMGDLNPVPVIEHVVDTTGLKVIPILDVRAAASVSGVINPDYITAEDVIRLPSHMIKSGLHVSIRIKGPSMAPTLQDGGHLLIRYLDRSEWATMQSEKVYFLVDIDNKAFIKRVKNRLSIGEKGFIVCMSDNPDKVSHPNFNLQWDEISHIWIAEWYLSAKMPNIHDTYFSRVSNLEDKVDLLMNELQGVKKQLK